MSGNKETSRTSRIKTPPSRKTRKIILKGIDMTNCFSSQFKEKLAKEFKHAHCVPIKVFICTCSPIKKNKKEYILTYPMPQDYHKKEAHVICDVSATDSDFEKLKRIFRD